MKKVFAILAMALSMFVAQAGELEDLVATKQVEYVGNCRFDKNDMLVFNESPDNKVVKCIVGFEPGEPDDLKYVLVYYNDKPAFLVEYSKVRKAQRVIWRAGSI